MNPFRYSLTTRLKESLIFGLLGEIGREDRTLDLGCGLGYFSEIMADGGARVAGMDLSMDSLRGVKARIRGQFIRGSAQRLPFRDGVFTKVLFTDVIEHLEDDRSAVREIWRVSRDGAEVVITTAALEGILTGSRLNLLFHDRPGEPEYHYRPGYTARGMSELLGNEGIEVVDVGFSTVFLGELFIEGLKFAFSFIKKDFSSQADALSVGDSWLFKIYRYLVFPPMYAIARLENLLLSPWLKGHIIVVKGVVRKPPRSGSHI